MTGYCPQEHAIFEKLSVYENLKYFSNLYNIKDYEETISNLIQLLGLSKHSMVETLSGGNKRRVNIACSMVSNPSILLMDEPTIEIDPVSRLGIWNIIKRINDTGTTVIISTNMIDEAKALSDRVLIIRNGKKMFEGMFRDIERNIFEWLS